MPSRGLVLLLCLLLPSCDRSPRAAPAGVLERLLTPDPVSVPPQRIAAASRLLGLAVEHERFPGGVMAIGNRDSIQAFVHAGRLTWDEDSPKPDVARTQYDLASLTKIVATTAAVMALVEDGRLRLDDPVGRYLPEFTRGDKQRVTIRHLLTHTGGLRAGAEGILDVPPARVRRFVLERPLALEPGSDVLYSDLGFIVLWLAAERAAGEPLQNYLRRRVWSPLRMTSTRMAVPSGCAACAPTLYLQEEDTPYTGGSYDELGRRLDGISGNAGAFSTAADLARFAGMIANEGRFGDRRVFARATVRAFTRVQRGTRALGWEVYCREGIVPDQRTCEQPYAFGHTGVTGTSLWIDPVSRTWVVLLTNRAYLPRDPEWDMQRFRRDVYEAALGLP